MSDSTEGELKGEEEPEKKVGAVGSGGGRGSKRVCSFCIEFFCIIVYSRPLNTGLNLGMNLGRS